MLDSFICPQYVHDDVMKWKHFRVTEFPAQRPMTRSFDVFFDLRLNKWLSKQSWGWWFETPSPPHDVTVMYKSKIDLICCGYDYVSVCEIDLSAVQYLQK